MRRSPATLGLLLCCAVFSGCGRSQAPERGEDELPVPVTATPAQTGSIRSTVRASGVVTPAEGAEFLAVAPEPARIVEITRDEGDPVAAGDLLVRFELPSSTQDVLRARSELAAAQAQLENARIAQTRTRDFVARGLVPRIENDAADRTLADAQAAVEKAQAADAAAAAAAARANVQAPFEGVVAQRFHQPGDLVQGTSTDPVLRVIDPRRLEVTATIPAGDVPRVLPGATARLTSPLDASVIRLTVSVRASHGQANADGSLPVRLDFAEPHQLPVDTRVDVEIDAEEQNDVVFVAPEAIVMQDGPPVVFVVNGDRAERRAVETGLADGQRVEITSGVRAGELVIVQGQFGLTDGTRISAAVSR